MDSRISELVELIRQANDAYYNTGVSIMSDASYDLLRRELQSLAPEHPELQNVGAPVSTHNKMSHTIPMGSLDNTDDGINGVPSWLNMVNKTINEQPRLFASLKIDGASICANYKDGALVNVLTRGNGEIGEIITSNAKKFVNLPHQLTEKVSVSVRGEVVLFKEDFLAICEEENIPEDERSNPRNTGNGIIGRDDGRNSDKMRVLAFNIVGEDASSLSTEKSKFELLQRLGFDVAPHRMCSGEEEFKLYYSEILNQRDNLPFEIDGIVVTLNEVSHQNAFVTLDKKSRMRPKYSRAVKFPHKSNITELIGVNLSVGHTGLIAPTALLETVRVGGVYVTNVLLNNWDEIERLGIQIGDKVEVVLAGDIIPKIVMKVEEGKSRTPITEPSHCPCCGSVTSRQLRGKTGANTFCTNSDCKEKKIGKISHWIGSSKKGVGILGIGDSILRAIYDLGLIKDPADLYELKVEHLENIELDGVRIGNSRAKTIVENIRGSMTLPLDMFLGSLGIDLLGRRRVKVLSGSAKGRLDRLDNWLDLGLLETIDLPGLGDSIRDAIVDGINDNIELINKLLRVGVVVNPIGNSKAIYVTNSTDTGEDKIAGKTFCFTGTRKFIPEVEERGGIIKSGVSKGLDYLVQADPLSTSGKTQKAEQYGTQIISLEYLEKLLSK